METTTNFEKHTNQNPISRLFLDNFFKQVVAILKPLGVASILDVGCGEGFTLDRLQKEHIGKMLVGVDAVEEALRIGKKLHPKLTLKKEDIYHLQYKANSFDVVLCTEVLEHLEKPDKALQELVRVSKKYILVTVPNEPYFTMQRFLRGKNILKLGDHPEHIQHWTCTGFQKFVKKQKAKIVVKKAPFPWTMLLLEKS